MSRNRSKKRIILLFIIILGFTLYLVGRRKRNEYVQKTVIKDARPEQVWNFMADFNNILNLNPMIISFKILSEAGNIHDWRYSVQYTENMSHWPYLHNTAIGHFSVTKSMKIHEDDDIIYAIHSNHSTCFLFGFYCLYTDCTYNFLKQDDATIFVETINYECPPFLGAMCRQEIVFQHNIIHYNLNQKFIEMRLSSNQKFK